MFTNRKHVYQRETGTRLSLLHGVELTHDGTVMSLPPSAQRLLVFLALQRGRVLRSYVAGVLWIDFSQDAANASLRTTLWRLRRPACPLVEASASHVALAPEVAVDLHDVTVFTERVLLGDGRHIDPRQLLELLQAGELLPDWYDDWVVIERERFRQQRLHALEAICDKLVSEGRYALAVETGLTAIALEPLRESTHRSVMRAHLAEGNRNEALRQYRLCRRLLQEQLGLEPSQDTELLRVRCDRRDAAVTRVA
jgi:DNA-binding SARP family transcriptional activator